MRARFIPEWLFRRYALLYKSLRSREFSMEDSRRVLGEEEKMAYGILSELAKAGWITRRFHPSDARRRIYQLRDPKEIIVEAIEEASRKRELEKG
jgi:DNA-binding MarR family transcriptional regulator